MSGSVKLPHSCLNCGKTVHTSVENLWLRTMPSGATNQSWYRSYRSKAQKK